MRVFLLLLLSSMILGVSASAQPAAVPTIPAVHGNLKLDSLGRVYLPYQQRRFVEQSPQGRYQLEAMKGNPTGSDVGIDFNFGEASFNGRLYFGFIPYGDARHPLPVYFRRSAEIKEGTASIDVKNWVSGVYDMVGWQASGRGTLGYRVLNEAGEMLYDGKVSFVGTGPFQVDTTLVLGPFLNKVTPTAATLSFETNREVVAEVAVAGRTYASAAPTRYHEITVDGLDPGTEYDYSVRYGSNAQDYTFKTAPPAGARSAFTFSYASDSRSGQGGGERNLYGTNFYMVKRIMALNAFKEVAFAQFSGDMINGYLSDRGEMDLQYVNWKRAIEPFANRYPIYVSMGNHEAFVHALVDSAGRNLLIDRFPFETESAEAVFAHHFVHPSNGPQSEDGAYYDPNPDQTDFPSYEENVFYYTYDNVAVVVLNSDYWYAPVAQAIPLTSGNAHGYLMDNQLAWLRETIQTLEDDDAIDHIFVTQHTPAFPNGGHVGDDMWYRGNNDIRPFVGRRAVAKGILERRDEYMDLLVNQSQKVVAILTGDEHNYNKLEIGPETVIYPENYALPKIELTRTIYQINNGAAGAPYYAQEQTPWTPFVSGFTTQNAVVFFHVDGPKIEMEVLNPDTLEPVDAFELR